MKLAILLTPLLALAADQPESRPAEPTVPEHDPVAKLGAIRGTIAPVEAVRRLWAIDRNLDLVYHAEIDRKSGAFQIENLLPGRYDLVAETTRGRFEGADLAFRESELEELARKEEEKQGIVREKPGPLAEADRKWITDHVFSVKRFEDYRKVDAIDGNSRQAAALVELLRRRAFHSMKGREVIWRVELWYFKKHYGGWEHVPNTDEVLIRRRMKAADFANLRHVFTPKLGAVRVDNEGGSQPVHFEIPPDARTDQDFKPGQS